MKNSDKTRRQLLKELEKSNKRIAELEKSEVRYKQDEKTLKESEKKYKGIVRSTASCIVVYKPVDNGKDFVFVDFNAMAEKVEQISKDKVIGRKVTEVFPGVIEFGLFKVFQNVLKTGKPEHFPVSIYKDDRIQGYRENYIYKLSSGEIVAVYQDFTERKRTEEALRTISQLNENIVNSSPIGISIYDSTGNCVAANDAAAKVIGATKAQVLQQNFHQLDSWKKSGLYDVALRSIQENVKKRHEIHVKTTFGKVCILDIHLVPIRIEDESHLLIMLDDITKQKRAEEELRDSEEHYRQLFNLLPYGGEIIDIEGKIIDCSLSTSRMLGYEMNELIGKHITNFVDAKSVTIFKQNFPKLLKGESLSLEGCMVHKDGSRINILRAAQPIFNADKEVTGMLALNIDITKRKQAEEKIQHLNLVLRAIRNVNQLIIEEKNRDVLIQKICDILTENRGYGNAWIVLFGENGEYIDSAESGLGKSFILMKKMLKEGKLTDCGNKALKQKDVVIIEDPGKECLDCPLSANYAGRGGYSICIKYGDNIYGLLTVSVLKSLIFDKEEQDLFREVSGDIGFALHDIEVEKKRYWVEGELRESEKKYRELIKTTSEGFWLINFEKKTIEANQSLCDMLGYSRNEIIGKTPLEFVDAENKKIFEEQTSKIISSVHRTYEISLKKKNGINFPAFFSATSLVDENGKPAGSFAFVTDITERKQAQEELDKAHERMELAMDAGEHSFWDWNLDTNDVYFSPRYYTMLGYKPGELPMRLETWVDLMHPDDRKTIVPDVENYVKNAQTYEVEFRLKTKDGNWRWISGRGKSYEKDKDGIPHRAVGVHVDITESKLAEEELAKHREHLEELVQERTKELEEKNEKLAQFNKLFVDREFRIKDLKDKVKELEGKLGRSI